MLNMMMISLLICEGADVFDVIKTGAVRDLFPAHHAFVTLPAPENLSASRE